MTTRTTTARVRSAKQDAAAIASELKWLIKNLPDLDVIGFSRDVRPEEVQPGGRHYGSRALMDEGRAEVRDAVLAAVRTLHESCNRLTYARVQCEKFFGGPSEDFDATGILVDPVELRALQRRQRVRVANEGDYRFGEWEPTPQASIARRRGG